MANMDTVDGINHAKDVAQWVLVWSLELGLILAQHNTSDQVTSSKHTMEVFDTEAELLTRVDILGYTIIEE